MTRTGFVIRGILVLAALWVGGFLAFADKVAQPAPDAIGVDGIAVFTGSAGRIATGLDILRANPGSRMLITGVGDGTAAAELARAHKVDKPLLDCCIELDRLAKDTVGNAEQTALWARRTGAASIVLVTAASHLPRAVVETRRQTNAVKLVPYPSKAGDDDPDTWLFRWSSLKKLGVEFHKYLFSLARARLSSDIGDVSRP